VVLVGQKKALAMAVKNHRGRRRHTKLAAWLSSGGRNLAGAEGVRTSGERMSPPSPTP